MKNSKIGICHICGENKQLTFEHIPPRSALNENSVNFYNSLEQIQSGNHPWSFDGLRYKQSQKGAGGYTLCEQCNNNMGTWYVNDFVDFIIKSYDSIKEYEIKENNIIYINTIGIYPLRIFKSILAMFCSINGENFSDNKGIRRLLLNKFEKGIDGNYGISLYAFTGSIMRRTGITAIAYNNGNIRVVSELSWIPFGFIYDVNKENNKDNFCITEFAKYGYDEKADITLKLAVREVNTAFATDFRNKNEIILQSNKNNEYNSP